MIEFIIPPYTWLIYIALLMLIFARSDEKRMKQKQLRDATRKLTGARVSMDPRSGHFEAMD